MVYPSVLMGYSVIVNQETETESGEKVYSRVHDINFSMRVAGWMRDFGLHPNDLYDVVNDEFRDRVVAALRNIEHRIARLVCYQFDTRWSDDRRERGMLDEIDPYNLADVPGLMGYVVDDFEPEFMNNEERDNALGLLQYCRYVTMVYLRWYADWRSLDDDYDKLPVWKIYTS